VAGFALSVGIELLQLAVPGRATATADVLCNTVGAGVGWLVASHVLRGAWRAPYPSCASMRFASRVRLLRWDAVSCAWSGPP
jgi:glycopeptide antibiotics resistance protein